MTKANRTAIRKRWLENLRSGKYQQGHGRLHSSYGDNDDRYCCLGVLCETIIELDPKALSYAFVRHRKIYGNHDRETSVAVPPLSVIKLVGLRPSGVNTLMGMNDNREYTFTKIADHIDKFPKLIWED